MRALAVLAVIFDHLLNWPSGGFVGVDVFFVISGFLITGLLLREYERDDRISFTGFYRRRFKRIIPAATVTLIVTVAAGFFLFNRARFFETLWDGVYAFFFAGNWHFAVEGTDYFQADGPVSPLQHFWSLSVEEQFYFVWPWLMLGLLLLAARFGLKRWRTIAGVVMGIIVLASFGWAMVDSTAHPTLSYFSTFTRAWELGAGALLAITAPWWSKLPAIMRPVLAWVGLLGILVSVFVINDTLPFPAPWAGLPVVATVLVIGAGTGARARYLQPLTNPVSGIIGDASYSLYLWHFPVIILVGSTIGTTSWQYFALVAALVIVLSGLSYYLVERPVLRSPWLEPKTSRSGRASEWRTWRERFGPWYKWAGIGTVAVIGLTAITATFWPSPPPPPTITVAKPAPTATSTAPSTTPQLDAIQKQLTAALASTDWPRGISDLVGAGSGLDAQTAACADPSTMKPQGCSWGDGTKHAILVGDSTANAYTPGFRDIFLKQGWSLTSYALNGCEFETIVVSNPTSQDLCQPRKDVAIAAIKASKPDLVIITSSWQPHIPVGQTKAITTQQWAQSVKEQVTAIEGSTTQVVYVAPPPYDVNIQDCYTPLSHPGDCISKPQIGWTNSADALKTLDADDPKFSYVDSSNWFCVTGQCPAFIGSILTKADRIHATDAYVKMLEPAMTEVLQPLIPSS